MLLPFATMSERIAASAGIPLRMDGPGVALTFDDGPHPEGTPAILDILDDAGAKATFFLAGEQVERYPGVARQVVARGHQVGLHCYRHHVQLRQRAGGVRVDMALGLAIIQDTTGVDVDLHRPPLGIYTQRGLDVVREVGLVPLLWSRWGKDWRKWTTPERIARRASDDLRDGDVILLHDADHYSSRGSWRRTAAALPAILAAIERAGLRLAQPTGSGSAVVSSDSVSQPK